MVSRSKSVVPANPSQWREQSQRSVSAEWTKEYRDIHYQCWKCKAGAVFTAQEQKFTFEVKKAPIDQRRILCEDCWQQSNQIVRELSENERRWLEQKPTLQKDREFLRRWLELLEEREKYVPYRSDTAKKNMLNKLLAEV
ncbi:MAG: zinc-ribbon domain containing protein [Pseudomonadota bacterium]